MGGKLEITNNSPLHSPSSGTGPSSWTGGVVLHQLSKTQREIHVMLPRKWVNNLVYVVLCLDVVAHLVMPLPQVPVETTSSPALCVCNIPGWYITSHSLQTQALDHLRGQSDILNNTTMETFLSRWPNVRLSAPALHKMFLLMLVLMSDYKGSAKHIDLHILYRCLHYRNTTSVPMF